MILQALTLVAAVVAAIASVANLASQGSREIANHRVRWIEDLRAELANFSYNSVTGRSTSERKYSEGRFLCSRRIILMLNEEEDEHKALISTLLAIPYSKNEDAESSAEPDEWDSKVILQGRKILKSEWNKAKTELKNWWRVWSV